jgi:alpha-glucosidase
MCLRGSVCLYQGEELGLREAVIAFEDLQDPYGIEFWPEFKGRDGCRTPMPWKHDNDMAGFTTAARTWLPIDAAHRLMSAERQAGDPGSMLAHYRAALAFRRAHSALRDGAQEGMRVAGDAVSFLRTGASEAIFCAFNLGDADARVAVPPGHWRDVGQTLGAVPIADGTMTLGPWQYCLAAGPRT